jgi:hypothetical protein
MLLLHGCKKGLPVSQCSFCAKARTKADLASALFCIFRAAFMTREWQRIRGLLDSLMILHLLGAY